jgi:CRP/FNR family transcriptional regulator, anaerobic regulatory protein
MIWMDNIPALLADSRRQLAALPVQSVAKGKVLFRAGDSAMGFVIVLSGRIEVMLTGPTGREIMLYAVDPGQSCVQTTLGLIGDEPYTGEASTVTDADVILIPKPLFLNLMDADAAFRGFVLRAFGTRMADLTRVLEQVAFGRVEVRLAALLLERAVDGRITATQADLAAHIGSAREVISRKLDGFARAGWIETERGHVIVKNHTALQNLARAL